MGLEGLVGESPSARKPGTPPPSSTPAAALCLSRKMVLESLWGREGKPHHLPLNVNYAFMNVFIGSDAPRPPPLCEPRGVGLSVAWAWGWAGRACRTCRRCRRRF